SVSRTLKSMEKRGLIERRPNPEDGRSILIYLTPYGQEMREYSKSIVHAFDSAVRENVEDKDLNTFIKVAETIIELIENKKIQHYKTGKHAEEKNKKSSSIRLGNYGKWYCLPFCKYRG